MGKSSVEPEYKGFIKILIGVVVFLGLIYLFTDKVVKKDTPTNDTNNVTDTTTKFNKTLIGTMLKEPQKHYWVVLYDSTEDDAGSFDGLQTNYLQSTTADKLYYVDLHSAANNKYVVESESNPKAKNVSELKVLHGTLIEVKDNKIVSYTEGYTNIYSKLQ